MIERDNRIDSVRGIMLAIMTLDHLNGDISRYTQQPFGFVSAAAGFILLSGFVYAITTKNFASLLDNLRGTARERALRIYLYHVTTLLILCTVATFIPLYSNYWKGVFLISDKNILHSLIDGLLLINQPQYCDILPMYIIFSFSSPLILFLFEKGKGEIVLIASVGIWAVGHSWNPHSLVAQYVGNGDQVSAFNIFRWQILWAGGLYLGFMRAKGISMQMFHDRKFILCASFVAVAFFIVRHGLISLPANARPYFAISSLGVLPLLNIAAQLVVFLNILRFINRHTSLGLFAFIGKYSIQVFSFHVLLVYLLSPITWRVNLTGLVGSMVYGVLVVASLAIPAMLYDRYQKVIRRRKTAGKKSIAASIVRPD